MIQKLVTIYTITLNTAADSEIWSSERWHLSRLSWCCSTELFGFDILIDDSLRPWVIEVNLSPSLAWSDLLSVGNSSVYTYTVLFCCCIFLYARLRIFCHWSNRSAWNFEWWYLSVSGAYFLHFGCSPRDVQMRPAFFIRLTVSDSVLQDVIKIERLR